MATFTNRNNTQVKGNLTKDPTLCLTGEPVVFFTVATNHSWVTKGGEEKKTAQFHDCKAFGDLAEEIAQKLHKGSHVLVEGWLSQETLKVTMDGKRTGKPVAVKDADGKLRVLYHKETILVATNVFLPLVCVDVVAEWESSAEDAEVVEAVEAVETVNS